MSTVATMRPLTNITVAAEQQTNRRSTPSAQPIDPTMCGQPCYGPSLPTQYQQFYDLSSGYSAQPTESTLQYTAQPFNPSLVTQYQSFMSHYHAALCQQLYAAGLYDPSKWQAVANGPAVPVATETPMPCTGGQSEPCQCVYCQAAQQQTQQYVVTATPERAGEYAAESDCGCLYTTPDEYYVPAPNTPSPQTECALPPQTVTTPANKPIEVTPVRDRTPPQQRTSRSSRRENTSGRRSQRAPNVGSAKKSSPLHNRVGDENIMTYSVRLEGQHGHVTEGVSAVALRPGDYVVFEGDRGEDLGKVTQIAEMPRGASANTSMDSRSHSKVPMVVRNATPDEVALWQGKLRDEADAAVSVCAQALASLGVKNLTIEHAVFQFDHKKLTFFYSSNERVDFRRLLPEMYSRYRCRIWMERLNDDDNHAARELYDA